ncbi:MAG TPA: glycosyltransferase 87 family protein [Acidimicrobiales bacterium]|nr:glycosyltransferase 87 family protein [Acidimicrobiales bacterium]
MTTPDYELDTQPHGLAGSRGFWRLTGWGPALVSFLAALTYGLYIALRTYEVDLGVYLRLGGRYVFTSHLYSIGLPNTSLLFTYPPFAALLFAPWERAFSTVGVVQTVWTMVNLAALLGLLVLSLRLVRPDLSRRTLWRVALALSLPAVLLNPVLMTIGFGQVNLVVVLLVMWDLLTERRIGRWQVLMGVGTGLAAAVKLTPLLFVPFLLLTRRFRAAATCVATFAACELVTYLASPASSTSYWTKALFDPGRAGDLSIVDNQNLSATLDRLNHGIIPDAVLMPLLLVAAAGGLWLAAVAHRRSSPLLGVLICAATGLLISPISWAHHMVWVVPAILWLALAPDRPRFGRAIAGATAVLFWCAPIWWVPYRNTTDLHLNPLQLVAGDSFFFALAVLLAGAAFLVFRRSRGVAPQASFASGPR